METTKNRSITNNHSSVTKQPEEVETPKLKRFEHSKLIKLASEHMDKIVSFDVETALVLTAQYPYANEGNMDFYKPGRWDTSSNLIFMDVIVQGPEPGEWDGTVGYVRFTAPADAYYVVFTYFTGYQITMRLHGPWGDVESYTDTTSDTGLVLAVWEAVAGDNLSFTIDCVGPIIGYLESILVYEVNF